MGALSRHPGHPVSSGSADLDTELGAAVHFVALGSVRRGTREAFFAVADRRDTVRRDAVHGQTVAHGPGAPLAQRNIVFGRPTLVAVAFDHAPRVVMVFQPSA